jgi:hypothetical protein
MHEPVQMSYRWLIVSLVAIVVAFVFGWWPSLIGREGTAVIMILAMIIAVLGAVKYHLGYREYLKRWRRGG